MTAVKRGSTRILTAGSGGPDTRPLGPQSVFEIGSVNKTFTGALLADMAARGEVSLDDPVARYLPEGMPMPSRGREITLVDLATHLSGLPRLPDNHQPADMADPYSDYTVETLYAFLSGHELRREPGAEGEYSNLGFGLLGHALARAADQSYRELLRTRILDPLGMDMTRYALEGDVAEWMVRGHDDGEVVSYWFGTEAIEGAGGLRSNMEDMLAYLKANMGPATTDLERAMQAAQEVRAPIPNIENAGIGLAWQVVQHDGREIVMHGGGTGGFSTQVAFDRDLGVGFVRLANTTGFGDDLGMDLLRQGPAADVPGGEIVGHLIIDGEVRTGRKISDEAPPPGADLVAEVLDLPLSAEDIARYEGTYLIPVGPQTLELRVFGEDGQLMSQAAGQNVSRLRHQGEHAFAPDFDDAARLVFTVEGDRAEQVTIHQGGSEFTGDRQP